MSSRAAATSPAATRGKKIERGERPRAQARPRPRETPRVRDRERSRTRLTPKAAVLVFSVFIVGMFSIAPIRSYVEQRARLDQLSRQAAELEQQNLQLQERIADLNDPRTLERLARECLGMVRPGEVAFVAIPRGEAPVPPRCG